MSYKYVLIISDVVAQVVHSKKPLEFDASMEWVDVTNANPSPDEGWRYNRVSKQFFALTEEAILVIEARSTARRQIDEAAGLARAKFTTDIHGQAEVYREKYEQAVDFLTSHETVSYNDYPLLQVEANIHEMPVKNIAENIIRKRSEWISKISAIEELRLFGKAKLTSCTSVNDIVKFKSSIIHQLREL